MTEQTKYSVYINGIKAAEHLEIESAVTMAETFISENKNTAVMIKREDNTEFTY